MKIGRQPEMDEGDALANSAVKEAEAQLAIAKAFQRLPRESRERVFRAVGHLLEAEAAVPGVFDALLRGAKQ